MSQKRTWKMPASDVIKDFELPSGNVVLEVKKPEMWMLVDEEGNVPSSIDAIINSNDAKDKIQDDVSSTDLVKSIGIGKTLLAMRDLSEIGGRVAKQIFLDPVIGDKMDIENGMITLGALTSEDKQFIAQWALSGGESDVERSLARFRLQQNKLTSIAQDGE